MLFTTLIRDTKFILHKRIPHLLLGGISFPLQFKNTRTNLFYLFQRVMPPSNKNIAPKSFECFMERPSPFRFIYYIRDSILFSTNTEYSFPGLDLKLSNKALVTNPWEFYPPHSKRTTLLPTKCLSLSTWQQSVLGEYFVPLLTRYYSTPFAVAPQYWCHLENTRTADGVGLQSGDSPFSVRKEMRVLEGSLFARTCHPTVL